MEIPFYSCCDGFSIAYLLNRQCADVHRGSMTSIDHDPPLLLPVPRLLGRCLSSKGQRRLLGVFLWTFGHGLAARELPWKQLLLWPWMSAQQTVASFSWVCGKGRGGHHKAPHSWYGPASLLWGRSGVSLYSNHQVSEPYSCTDSTAAWNRHILKALLSEDILIIYQKFKKCGPIWDLIYLGRVSHNILKFWHLPEWISTLSPAFILPLTTRA